ncbi:MAG: hypothetical protein J6V40_05995 [Clostridia bacterium]|nr:hypothetical protein [Clostridia bacterium]
MKKRFITILLLPLLLFTTLFTGCDDKYTYATLRDLYVKMVSDYNTSSVDFFGGVNDNPGKEQMLVITYGNVDVATAVNNNAPVTELDKRFVALKTIDQNILDYIFNYYQKWSADFYTKISSAEYSKKEMENLHFKLENLYSTLGSFAVKKEQFEKDVKALEISNVMVYSVTEFTYEVNKVIEASLEFMNAFIDMHNKYCVKLDVLSDSYLNRLIDDTYVRIAEMVYYENVKSFNYSLGDKGSCDLLDIMETSTTHKYSQIGAITMGILDLSDDIKGGMVTDSPNYAKTMDIIDEYIYCFNIFSQRRQIYLELYSSFNMYALNKYRFEKTTDVTIDEYVSSFSTIDKVNYTMLEDISNNTFKNLVLKLHNLI